MPTKPIFFGNAQQSGDERLAGASPVSINVVIDGKGTVRRRPVIQAYDRAPGGAIDSTGIQGLHVTNGGKLYAVGGSTPSRTLYRIAGGAAAPLGGSTNPDLTGTLRPIFAETEALVVIAGGDLIQKIELAGDVTDRLGGDPPRASHVAANAQRLEANDMVVDRSKIRFSGQASGTTDYSGLEDWAFGGVGLAGFFSANARPDPVQGVFENTNELFVPGSTNLQVFVPVEGQDDWATVSTREYGLVAPYSFIKVDQAFAWMDHRRRFVVSDGRTFEIISDGMGADFDTIEDPSDCYGYRVHEGPIDCLVWTFPSDGRTFAYQRGGGWGQWQGRNEGGNNWARLPILSHTHDQNTDDNIVGTLDGEVGILQMGGDNDLGDEVVAYTETGFQNRGTDRRKHCVSVRLTFERGQAYQPVSSPVGLLQYADAPDKWSEPRTVSLGSDGDTSPVVRFRSLGIYRRRAWRFTFSAPEDLVLASVEEEFEILEQ